MTSVRAENKLGMASIKLSTVVVNASRRYDVQLNEQVTVGGIARYLSQHEAYVDATTLEMARPVLPAQRLQDLDIQVGDRLLIFTQPPQLTDLPAALTPGDKTLKFSLGDIEISSRGKKSLLVGKPDEAREIFPDIDLRNFISPTLLGFVSRECLRVEFDEQSKLWYAEKIGQTRLMIDDFELSDEKVALDGERWLRFYRASDDPKHPDCRPVGVIHVQVEEMQSRPDVSYFRSGSRHLAMCVGTERESHTLNASESLTLGRVVAGLAAYNKTVLSPSYRLFLMRLVSPNTPIQSFNLGSDGFLYAPRNHHYAQNLLFLRDVHNRRRVYSLFAGLEDGEKLIGRRLDVGVKDTALDVDLFDAIITRDMDTKTFKNISRYMAWVYYKASENTWWVRLEERTLVPVFINNTRMSGSTPIQLTSGDVLSFGPTIDNYYARLEVEITSKAD
jgi:hypothetical protein